MKLLIILLLLSFNVFADTGDVAYQPPTERVDNSPLLPSEIGGFNVYSEAGVKILTLTAGAKSFTVDALGQTLFITCFDTEGRESAYSQAIIIPVGKVAPKSPGGATVTVIIGGSGG